MYVYIYIYVCGSVSVCVWVWMGVCMCLCLCVFVKLSKCIYRYRSIDTDTHIDAQYNEFLLFRSQLATGRLPSGRGADTLSHLPHYPSKHIIYFASMIVSPPKYNTMYIHTHTHTQRERELTTAPKTPDGPMRFEMYHRINLIICYILQT